MRRTIALLLVLVLVAASAVMFLPAEAEAQIIVVPYHYASIEAAIANANTGDTILVMEGTYEENTLEINKPISLIGNNPEQTILKNNGQSELTGIHSHGQSILRINANGVHISGFTINGIRPIILSGNNTTIVRNIIVRCGSGIKIDGNNNKIAGNKFSGSGNDIIRCMGSHNTISGNALTYDDTEKGFVQIDGSYNIVSNNSVSSIWIRGRSNMIFNNSIKVRSGDCGIYLSQASKNVVFKNRITCAKLNTSSCYTHGGITLQDSLENVFYANQIEHNRFAVHLSCSYNNTFHQNNFIDNKDQVWLTYTWIGTNSFDNGIIGNFWSGYRGTDADGDGIGDTPNGVAGSSDHYPLITRVDIDRVIIELPEWELNLQPEPEGTYPQVTESEPEQYEQEGTVLSTVPLVEPQESEIEEKESFPILPIATASAAIIAIVNVCLALCYRKKSRIQKP